MTTSTTASAQRPVQADILDAAARCFMERGYTATSINDVARSLDATKGRIYHHYRSKADLFFNVYRYGMQMNFDSIMPLAEKNTPATEKLRRMAKTHCIAMIRTQPFQRCVWEGDEMLLRGSTTPMQRETLVELHAMRTDYSEVFRTVIEQAKEDGAASFDNSSIALQLMFMSLNSPLFWYRQREDQDDEAIDRIADQCTKFALRGLGLKEELTADV